MFYLRRNLRYSSFVVAVLLLLVCLSARPFLSNASAQSLSSSSGAISSDLYLAYRETLYDEGFDSAYIQQAKLTAPDAAADDAFGSAVAISGDTALIGARGADPFGLSMAGAAYVFVRVGTDWTFQAKLTASDAGSGPTDWFGSAVALEGDTAVVGAYTAYPLGGAYIFTRSGTTWTEQAKLTASDGEPGFNFGASVAISGDTVLVGSNYAMVSGEPDAGAAYVFVRSGTTWIEQAKLTASDLGSGDNFGAFVALEGDTALISAPEANVSGFWRAGAVYIFSRAGTTWTEQGKLTSPNPGNGYNFGVSVDISGNTLALGEPAVGAWPPLPTGAAYVFVQSGTTWTEQAKLTAFDAARDYFGYSVALEGDTVVAGAILADLNDPVRSNAGAAYMFTRIGDEWLQRDKLITSDATSGDLAGIDLALEGNMLMVGVPYADITNPTRVNAGATYIFDLSVPTELLTNGDFGAPMGTGNRSWNVFASPSDAIVHRIENGVFEFYSQPASQQVVLLQNTGIPLAANTGLNVQLDLGNSSANRKRVSVLMHDAGFTDLQICTFWLPPNTPLRTYTMQARTSQAWTNASLSIYANTADGAGWYRVDNVTMTQMQTTLPASTLCTDPGAPAALGGADGANLVLNGDFAATIPLPSGNPAVGNWWSYAGITWQQVGGELQTYRPSGTPPGGVMIQNTGAAVPSGMPLEATMQLGNNSASYRYVKVLLHDADFSDFGVCAFWLPPNTPLGNYTMRTYTTEAWTNATVAIYPNPAYPAGWIRTDNVTLRQRPGLTLTGTQCYEPGAPIPAPAAPFADATTGEAESIRGDTLPSGELPLIATAVPFEAQSAADGEGEFSE